MSNRKLKRILSLLAVLCVTCIASVAFAQDAGDKAAKAPEYFKWLAIATGFGISFAAIGGALAQGKTAATALDGIARNPNAADKLFTPMILGLALIESLVIYALIISFLLLGKLP